MKKVIFISALLCSVLCGCSEKEVSTQTYMVSPGDTLWSIATEYCPKNIDKRDYISDIIELNHIEDCTIYPHRSIQVIVY